MTQNDTSSKTAASDVEAENAKASDSAARNESPNRAHPEEGQTWPSEPRGAKPNTAMCENSSKPGMIDKTKDC